MIKIVVNNGMLLEAKRARLSHKLYFCKKSVRKQIMQTFPPGGTTVFLPIHQVVPWLAPQQNFANDKKYTKVDIGEIFDFLRLLSSLNLE